MLIFIDLIIIIVDHLLLVNLLHLICKPKQNPIASSFVITSILIIENLFIANIIRDNVYVNFIPIVTLLIYSIAFLKGSIFKRIISCLLIFVNLIIINSLFIIIGSLFSPSIYDFIYNSNNYIAYFIAVFNKIFIFLEYLYLKKASIKELELSLKTWVFIIIILAISVISISLSLSAYISNSFSILYFVIIISTLFLVNILVFKLCLDITRKNIEKYNHEIYIKSMNYEERILNILQEKELALRNANHDFKYHISIISEMIKNNEQKEVKEYFSNLNLESSNVDYVHTNNPVLNFILNDKIKLAKELNIEIKKDISGIEYDNSYISNVDINIILGNLLDNAIESCKTVDGDKFIDIKISIHDHKTEFTISNSTIRKYIPINSKLSTTKNDTKLHGHGLNNIANIVKKYGGEIVYSANDYVFTYFCTLLNK